MPEISIVETRNIIRVIRQKYNFDFSQYTLTAFRFGLDRTILRHHLRYPELLASRILEDEEFFDELLFDINDVMVELFRDPETWVLLKSNILPHLFETVSMPRIWFPGVCTVQDIFTLILLLNVEFPEKLVTIYISTFSDKLIDIISKGEISAKQLESGMENFEKVIPKCYIKNFLVANEKDSILSGPLFNKITFIKQNLIPDPLPENSDLIIYRNIMLNYTPESQKILLDKLFNSLDNNGFLITGIKENIEDYTVKKSNLQIFDKNEKVYIKLTN